MHDIFAALILPALIVIGLVWICYESFKNTRRTNESQRAYGSHGYTSRQHVSYSEESRGGGGESGVTRRRGRTVDLDLHGYRLRDAMDLVHTELDKGWDGRKSTLIITGRGAHSPDGVPVIKNAVKEYLDSQGFRYREDLGAFTVTH